MPVRSLGYLRIGAEDPGAWRRFAVELLGMMQVDGDDPSRLYFRMDGYPPRLVVSPAPVASVESIGFELSGPEEMAETTACLEAAGTKVTTLDPPACLDRRVAAAASFDDPGGNHLEVFWGAALDHREVVTPAVSAFVTADQGMGHVVLTTPAGQESYQFYTRLLGFKGRNTMRVPSPGGGAETLWFLGCNARHHTVGLLPMAGPGRLVHFMVEAATLDDVGRAWDRVERLGIPVMQTLGRHTNDRMVSFYAISPSGFAVEFGYDGLRVAGDPPVQEITEGALWGHRFVSFPRI